MKMTVDLWRWVFVVGVSSAVAALVRLIFCVQLLPRPVGGFSGEQRLHLVRRSSLLEVCLRWGGSMIGELGRGIERMHPGLVVLLERAAAHQARRLVWAGCPWGLTVHEAWFISLLCGGMGVLVGCQVSAAVQTWLWLFPCGGAGLAFFPLRLRALAEERWLTVSHEFPVVIDLTALAMNAGADLPSALAKVAQRKSGPAGDEIRQFLTALDMGVTRRSALLALEERCPIDEVRDVVRAISMADQKGASVTEALVQQAQTSRLRRSVKAEESAARAGVLLMLPMMLLVACVVILLVGPLLCEANVL